MFRPRGWTLLGGGAGLLAATLLLAFPTGLFQAWDQPADALLRGLDALPLVLAAKALDFMGSIEFVGAALLALVGLLVLERRPRDAALVLGAFLVAEVLTDALKVLFARARPLDGLLETASASFPSGHAMRGAILALLFAWYLAPKLAARPRLRLAAVGVLAAWGASMALARLVLHVHWLSDVVMGSALGLAVGALGLSFATPAPRRVEVSQPAPVAERAPEAREPPLRS